MLTVREHPTRYSPLRSMPDVRSLMTYSALTAIGVMTVAPYVWMVFTSLHPPLAPLPTPDRLLRAVWPGRAERGVGGFRCRSARRCW